MRPRLGPVSLGDELIDRFDALDPFDSFDPYEPPGPYDLNETYETETCETYETYEAYGAFAPFRPADRDGAIPAAVARPASLPGPSLSPCACGAPLTADNNGTTDGGRDFPWHPMAATARREKQHLPIWAPAGGSQTTQAAQAAQAAQTTQTAQTTLGHMIPASHTSAGTDASANLFRAPPVAMWPQRMSIFSPTSAGASTVSVDGDERDGGHRRLVLGPVSGPASAPWTANTTAATTAAASSAGFHHRTHHRVHQRGHHPGHHPGHHLVHQPTHRPVHHRAASFDGRPEALPYPPERVGRAARPWITTAVHPGIDELEEEAVPPDRPGWPGQPGPQFQLCAPGDLAPPCGSAWPTRRSSTRLRRHDAAAATAAAAATEPSRPAVPASASRARTFKPMQMVFREGRRASSSSMSTNGSGGGAGGVSTGTSTSTVRRSSSGSYGTAMTDATAGAASPPVPLSLSLSLHLSLPLTPPPPPLSPLPLPPRRLSSPALDLTPHEQAFRRQQGISLNYQGDIHNPQNRSDNVPAHLNTSLFLMGLPPRATVGDLLRAVAALGPTGRVFAASVSPADPARRLPHAAAKISFFTRAQAERFKALVDAHRLVMADGGEAVPSPGWSRPGNDQTRAQPQSQAFVIRCAWNRDRKAPRRCVQPSECRVLRIRGPRSMVNYAALTAYFDEKFRYELQDVRTIADDDDDGSANDDGRLTERTMEWRFASFQSQAIAAKMALNQERKMVRVEYGRDPCEWGEV